ncbi:hypothetical protein [Mesorhizobium sp. STM 4661]|uniref:hypothetical protein n=1 Tax=Mesorhizobium sp. STM 4661 TaxID=1297570 RepID=UPI0002C00242|nr:hypothetical protein [Mesorhizobium sp. STM 4661]CCV15059.1 hypothetical protein MESS4_740042 [Mesorhizobium sp. STM 4661]
MLGGWNKRPTAETRAGSPQVDGLAIDMDFDARDSGLSRIAVQVERDGRLSAVTAVNGASGPIGPAG